MILTVEQWELVLRTTRNGLRARDKYEPVVEDDSPVILLMPYESAEVAFELIRKLVGEVGTLVERVQKLESVARGEQ